MGKGGCGYETVGVGGCDAAIIITIAENWLECVYPGIVVSLRHHHT